ncbi:MAG: twin-arginine translocase TatA/TatE family subunit [Bdellovibrionales bacterium]|nr:twin-arginine translocase TatA/TatE family subunit [Bdellovibrionales bacterium]
MMGGGQLLIIVIVLVVLFVAPSRLPGLGKSLAQAIRGFKKGMAGDDEVDVTDSVKQEKLDEGQNNQAQSQTQKDKDKV